MFDLIQNLMYSFLALQEKYLRKKLRRYLKTSFSNSTTKKTIGQAASLEISSKTKTNKTKLENDLKIILKKYENKPEKLIAFVKRSGTTVYRTKYAKKLLNLIGYEEGFVGSTEGIKALYLNTIVPFIVGEKTKISFHAEPMFILKNSELDPFYTIQQFHKWYAMKLKLPGFNAEAQNNFQKFLNSNNEETKSLSLEEILDLKEAIARDVEAINFIVDLAKSTDGSQGALKKITAGGASI